MKKQLRLFGEMVGLLVLLGCGLTVPVTTAPEATVNPVIGVENTIQLEATETPSPTDTPSPTASPTIIPEIILDPPADVDFTLPPVVQHVTDTTAHIFFELAEEIEVEVFYGVDDGSPMDRISLTAGRYHQVVLEELEAGRRYRVRVAVKVDEHKYQPVYFQGEDWPLTFHTDGDEEPIRFGVIGDSGFGGQMTYDLAAGMAGRDLDFVVHTGDVVYKMYDDPDPYTSYRLKWYLPLEPLLQTMPVYPVTGNHDVEEAARWNGTPFYYYVFPPFGDSAFEGRNQWYAFGYGDVQFIMLDTQVYFNEPGRAEQDAWLAERLADTRYRLHIPIFHVTAYSSGLHPNDGTAARQAWMPMFQQAAVPIIFSGHDHNYERLLVDGLTYIVSGGGSAVVYGQETQLQESQIFVQKSHYVIVEIFENMIGIQAFDVDGNVIDEFIIPGL